MAASGIVARARVARLLAGAWERRVTLVVAGAGYGKTTALRQLTAGRPTAWLALTAADRDVEMLSARAVRAIGGERAPDGKPVPAIGATDRRSRADSQAALICESIDAHDGPLMLVLDELEQLSDDDSASQFLSALCLQAPPHLHVVLSGRQLPALRLGLASGRGELLELAAPDLAFTTEETAALLATRFGPAAEPLADECWALTSGWPAALSLMADRLERLDPRERGWTLAGLRNRSGQIWREFASDLIEQEPPPAQRTLAIAAVAPLVDVELLEALDVADPSGQLEDLQGRGLLVASGERGACTLSPVLSEAMAARVPREQADQLRHDAVEWLGAAGRLEEALECAAGGPGAQTHALLKRRGRELVAGGYGSRVAEIVAGLDVHDDPELDTIRAEALVAIGDWDRAIGCFGEIRRRTAPWPLAASTAWRFGALLYLRGEIGAAEEVLSAAEKDGADSDLALVSAWLSSTLWGRGDLERAEQLAEAALRQAQAARDPSAGAAAHVAVALCAASRGQRERNARHYRLALQAATDANDPVQLARIHANLSSSAVEEGDYRRAMHEADEALTAGAGHHMFGAIATNNKAEALLRSGEVEQARALALEAVEMFSELGSLMASAPYALLGEIEAERGDLVRGRIALERAHRLAEEGGDVHAMVVALAGLAWLLAQDDPEAARALAEEAMRHATGLERAQALCVRSWVTLCVGDRAAAVELAAEAEAEARRTTGRASLARALELRGAASEPPDQARIEAAVELWQELGDPIARQRAELLVAITRGEGERAEALRRELARRGVQPDTGLAGLLAGSHAAEAVAVTTLGRFTVSRAGQAIPLIAWQSRKARDLLKLLASRQGRPVTREVAAEALWPGEDAAPLPNRLSVALSTLRKVLDPDRSQPAGHFIAADNQTLTLRLEHVKLDVMSFLEVARAGVALASEGDWSAAEVKLHQAEGLYTGDFLEEDLYEDWSVECREEARWAAQEVSRLLARAAVDRGEDEEASRHLRRLLERDPYDADAWTALLGAQLRMQRYGEARRQHALYARRMAELDLSPVPLADAVGTRP